MGKQNTKKIAVTPEQQCRFEWDERDADGVNTHKRCNRDRLTKEHCWAHYQQGRRGHDLTPIRERNAKGASKTPLVTLAGNIRVEAKVAAQLKKRVKAGLAASIYEATHQAVTEGVWSWCDKEVAKASKK